MVAELAFYRRADLVLLQLECHVGKLRHHLPLGEKVEITPLLLRSRILGKFLRQLFERLAFFGALGNALREFLLLRDHLGLCTLGHHQEDVARAHLLGCLEFVRVLVVKSLRVGVVHGVLAADLRLDPFLLAQ